MAKIQTISGLFAHTCEQVTNSPAAWRDFLTTAARFYKAYDFDDQLLIYAQRPNATACADIGFWNNDMHRWVNAGSTAIALIRKGYGGKPYLAKEPDIHFNLSHSGEWAVCAISSSPVGVDIQHCDEGRRDVASRFFHREEIRYLDSLPQFRRDEGFYRLWTLKESFVKATGRGLDLPLRSFWVDIRRGRPQIDCGNIEGQYKLFELDFPADKAYRLAVCVRDLSESEPRLMIL